MCGLGWPDKDTMGTLLCERAAGCCPTRKSVFEAEQVILAPEVDDWTHQWQHRLGLRSTLQVRRKMKILQTSWQQVTSRNAQELAGSTSACSSAASAHHTIKTI
jgi:hypothetical protein